jgi:hypothetical protein
MSENLGNVNMAVGSLLESMINGAPDALEAAISTPAGWEQPNTPTHPLKPNFVRVSSGWGEKYREPIELRGEQWLAVMADASRIVATGGIVAFLGKRGPGKTQMAAEIARAGDWPHDKRAFKDGQAQDKRQTATYTRAMDLFLRLRAANHRDAKTTEKAILDELRGVGLLVIDEFQERGESDWENRIITHLIDCRYADQRPTIIIANLTREEAAASLSPSVKDRIRENGQPFVFDWPSFRAKQPQPTAQQ